MYFLDTNTCIYYLNGKYESIKRKILGLPPKQDCHFMHRQGRIAVWRVQEP